MVETKYYCDVCGAEICTFHPYLEEATITVELPGGQHKFRLQFCEKHTGYREFFAGDIRMALIKGLKEWFENE